MRIKDNRKEPVAILFMDLNCGAVFQIPDDHDFYLKLDKFETIDNYHYNAINLSCCSFCSFASLDDDEQVIEVSATLLIDHKQ